MKKAPIIKSPSFPAALAALLVCAGAPCHAEPIPFYTSSVFGPADPANANEWSGVNLTNVSVIFEAFIDYTETVVDFTEPFTVFENGADAIGSGVAINGEDIVFAAGGSSVATTAAAIGPHGLTAGQTGVQIVALLEFGGGTDDNEKLEVYVNGELVASADNPTNDDWAGANGSHLGVADAFSIFEYVPSINPNAGDGANGFFTQDYPDPGTTISFAAYELGLGDNTLENILVTPPSGGPPALTIVANTETAGNFDFSWETAEGMAYDLVSSTDLTTPPAEWPVWEGHENIVDGTLVNVPGGPEGTRFFALVEKEASP